MSAARPRAIRTLLRWAFVGLGVLVVGLVVAAIVIARDIHDSAQTSYFRQVLPLRRVVLDLELQLVNEETGVRGYVITANRTSLEPYVMGTRAATADVSLLSARAEDDPGLAPLVVPVLRLRSRLNTFFRREVHLVASGRHGRAQAASRIDSGKTLFDGFLSAIAAVQSYAAIRTDQASQRQDRLLTRLTAIVGGAGLAAIVLVVLLAWRVPQRVFLLVRDQQRASEQAGRLQVEAETMQSMTADLSSSVTVDDVRAALVRAGRTLLGADAVGIGLIDPEHDTLDVWTQGLSADRAAELDQPERAGESTGAAAIRDGQARFVQHDPSDPRFPASAVLPLVAPGERPRGYLALHYREERPFPAEEQTSLRGVAAQVESALRRAESHDRERRTAEALQRALLPAALPTPADGRLVGYYRPGSRGALVGGDWYDAVEHEDGRIAGSVGDVAGHGIIAAAQMGRLRHSYRAYALEHRGPAEILARLTRHIGVDAMATVVCFEVEPDTRRLRYCSAGHLPALVYYPGTGEVQVLDRVAAPPIGVADPSEFTDTVVTLKGPSILFAYTDGLIEQRTVGLGDRIDALAAKLAETPPADLHGYVRAIVVAMREGSDHEDDIAILALTTP